jgi:hypothetical protein
MTGIPGCPHCDELRAPETDDEPWSVADVPRYTGAWITGAILAFPILLAIAVAVARRLVR